MTYVEQLQTVRHPDGRVLVGGSFRGVPFYVPGTSESGGRRLAVHEFALSSITSLTDLGIKTLREAVELYLLGEDALQQSRALVTALVSKSTVGELILPQLPRPILARCESYELPYSVSEARIVRMSVRFVADDSSLLQPRASADRQARVSSAAQNADAAVGSDATANVVVNQPSFAKESLVADVTGFSRAAESELLRISTSASERATVSALLSGIINDATSLVDDVDALFARFAAVWTAMDTTRRAAARDFFRALMEISELEDYPQAIGTTQVRETERRNQQQIGDGLRASAATFAARIIVEIEYVALDDAIEDRDRNIARLDGIWPTAKEAAFDALRTLRAAVVQAVPGDRALAETLTVSRPLAIPAFLISYQLYGDAGREKDIIARNNVRNPGLVAGTVEVLTDV